MPCQLSFQKGYCKLFLKCLWLMQNNLLVSITNILKLNFFFENIFLRQFKIFFIVSNQAGELVQIFFFLVINNFLDLGACNSVHMTARKFCELIPPTVLLVCYPIEQKKLFKCLIVHVHKQIRKPRPCRFYFLRDNGVQSLLSVGKLTHQ